MPPPETCRIHRWPVINSLRRLCRKVFILAMAIACLSDDSAGQRTSPVQEKVTVERVVITGHVIDRFAKPIHGLTVDDFVLLVDGIPTPIESVDWIETVQFLETRTPVVRADRSGSASTELGLPGSPRLTVLLFQWEISGQKDTGFVRMMRQAKSLIESSGPDDLFAVLGFGSSLRLLQDFTNSHETIERAILNVRSLGWKSPVPESGRPALTTGITDCGRTDSIEAGLTCIGKGLDRLPGPKSLLFFGWSAATNEHTWRARAPSVIESVTKAETSVFVLDVSDGRRYGKRLLLESLKTLAFETGGLYQTTYDFPDLARNRVQRTLDGYYELTFRNQPTSRGWHRVDVELARRLGTALFRRWFQD